jgi:hypothetical protein
VGLVVAAAIGTAPAQTLNMGVLVVVVVGLPIQVLVVAVVVIRVGMVVVLPARRSPARVVQVIVL